MLPVDFCFPIFSRLSDVVVSPAHRAARYCAVDIGQIIVENRRRDKRNIIQIVDPNMHSKFAHDTIADLVKRETKAVETSGKLARDEIRLLSMLRDSRTLRNQICRYADYRNRYGDNNNYNNNLASMCTRYYLQLLRESNVTG